MFLCSPGGSLGGSLGPLGNPTRHHLFVSPPPVSIPRGPNGPGELYSLYHLFISPPPVSIHRGAKGHKHLVLLIIFTSPPVSIPRGVGEDPATDKTSPIKTKQSKPQDKTRQDKTTQAQTRQENTRPEKRLLLCFKRSKPARLKTMSNMHYFVLDVHNIFLDRPRWHV